MEDKFVDLILIYHIFDINKKPYMFKSKPGTINVGDLVQTREHGTDKSIGIVTNVYRNIAIGSDEYNFICRAGQVNDITGWIYSKFIESKIDNCIN